MTQLANYGITKGNLADHSGILTDDITYLQGVRNLSDVASASTANSNLFVNSLLAPTPTANAFTLDETSFGSFVSLTNSGTPYTVALSANATPGYVTLYNEDSASGTVSFGGGTIDGNASYVLAGTATVTLFFDGANYHTMSYGPAGASGDGAVLTVQGTISAADLLTLVATPKAIITGTPNFGIVPMAVSLEYVYGTTAYTVGSGSVVGFQVAGGAQYGQTTPCAGLFDQTNNVYSSVSGLTITAVPTPATYLFGSDFIINITGGTGLTLGDGTLNYWVSYMLIPAI